MLKELKAKSYKLKASVSGQAALEILIALGILVLSTSAAILVAFGSQSTSVGTETNAEALLKATEQMEEARAESRQDFGLVSPLASTYTSGPLTYNLRLDVKPIDSFTKQVTSTVWWNSGGQTLSVALSTVLTDWINGGSKCSPTLSGDWTAPQVYGYIDFSSSEGATGVNVQGKKAYVTSDPSAAGTDDFYVIDVTDPSPGKGSLPILGHFSTSYGLTDVRAAGTYAYVAADSASYQLLVIDVTDPAALDTSKIKKKIDVTAPSDTAIGNTLFYAKKTIYLGLTKSSGPEFYIIDVSIPTAPVVKGSYEVGGAVNQIVVKNNTAYLATAATNEIIMLDVTDALNPLFQGAYTSATLTGQSLAPDNTTTLYFGRIGGIGNPKLLAFDTTNLTTPKWTMDMNKQSGVYTMVLRSNLVFMTTADPSDGLQIWDIAKASATTPPTRYDTTPLNIQQTATAGVDCSGNLLYVAQRSNRALQIVGPYVPNTYALSNSGNIVVNQGASGNTTITNTLISGSPSSVTLSVSGYPASATPTFTNNPCTSTCSSQLTIATILGTPVGTYPITVTGTGGVMTTFNLVVTAQPFDYTLSTPSDVTIVRAGASVNNTVTVTMIAGAPQSVTLTPSGLPLGVSASPAPASCTPTATTPYQCTVTLSYSAADTAILGTAAVIVNGNSPAHSTNFTLTVNAPVFTYTLPNNISNFTITRGGPVVPLAVTVTMTPGAVPQLVTLTPSNPAPGDIVVNPSTASCTPTATTPYQCTVSFNYSSPPTAAKGTYNNQQVIASPGSESSNKFQIKVN